MYNQYLSIEERFKDALSNEEMLRIKDQELRDIRMRHWIYQNKIHHDYANISDEELCRLVDIDCEKEKREIEEYRKRKGI